MVKSALLAVSVYSKSECNSNSQLCKANQFVELKNCQGLVASVRIKQIWKALYVKHVNDASRTMVVDYILVIHGAA